jgi:hypothetical protein
MFYLIFILYNFRMDQDVDLDRAGQVLQTCKESSMIRNFTIECGYLVIDKYLSFSNGKCI